jgi:hypothetical protein
LSCFPTGVESCQTNCKTLSEMLEGAWQTGSNSATWIRPHDQRRRPQRQPRQCGAQHRAAHARRQGRGGAQRAAAWAEPAGAGRSGAGARGRRAGAADRRGGGGRGAPCRRGPHRRGAGRHRARPPRAYADHDGRVRGRRRHHQAADAARSLRAARAVAAEGGDHGVRCAGDRGRPAAAAQSVAHGRGRRRVARVLAEQSRFSERDRHNCRIRKDLFPSPSAPASLARGEPEDRRLAWRGGGGGLRWILAEQSRFGERPTYVRSANRIRPEQFGTNEATVAERTHRFRSLGGRSSRKRPLIPTRLRPSGYGGAGPLPLVRRSFGEGGAAGRRSAGAVRPSHRSITSSAPPGSPPRPAAGSPARPAAPRRAP